MIEEATAGGRCVDVTAMMGQRRQERLAELVAQSAGRGTSAHDHSLHVLGRRREASSCLQLAVQHPHERHAGPREHPAVEADVDRWCRCRNWRPDDAGSPGTSDEVQRVDVADAGVAVPELHLESLGWPRHLDKEQVAGLSDQHPVREADRHLLLRPELLVQADAVVLRTLAACSTSRARLAIDCCPTFGMHILASLLVRWYAHEEPRRAGCRAGLVFMLSRWCSLCRHLRHGGACAGLIDDGRILTVAASRLAAAVPALGASDTPAGRLMWTSGVLRLTTLTTHLATGARPRLVADLASAASRSVRRLGRFPAVRRLLFLA